MPPPRNIAFSLRQVDLSAIRDQRPLSEKYQLSLVEDRPATRFPGLGVVLVASVVARTPDVALPAEPEPVEVGERFA